MRLLSASAAIAWLSLAAALPLQTPFISEPSTRPNLSAELFRSLHGLLKSWSQAFEPNGRAIIPGSIAPGTMLYHGRPDSHPPTSGYEWLALDPEHAYMFASMGPNSTLSTYVATQPLKILYFDGFSASKGNPGSQDLQELLAWGPADPEPGFKDPLIANALCQWAGEHGVGGFVREEATFEVIWCDFSIGVQLVRTVPSSTPDSEPPRPPPQLQAVEGGEYVESPEAVSSTEEMILTQHNLANKEPGQQPPPPHHRTSVWQPTWQMLNAASWHYTNRDSRVKLSPQYVTTLTDADFTSLWSIYDKKPRARRVEGISKADWRTYKASLEENVKAWLNDQGAGTRDYLSISDVIVERTAGRLQRMATYMQQDNVTEAISKVQEDALAILFPYLDAMRTLSKGAARPDARTRSAAIKESVPQCTTGYTLGYASQESVSKSEQLLVDAIEGVLGRICTFAGEVLEQSLSAEVRLLRAPVHHASVKHLLQDWQEKLEVLMAWLSWPVWNKCEDTCADDEICYVPMWPVFIDTTTETQTKQKLQPHCVKRPLDWSHGDGKRPHGPGFRPIPPALES